MREGRVQTVALAVRKLAEYDPDVPVIATLTGPVSAAASVVDPMSFFRGLKKDPESSHRLMEYITEVISAFAGLLIQSGASVIAIADPTATGELLSPELFGQYAVPYLRKLVNSIHAASIPAIAHICGKVGSVADQFQNIGAEVISVDAMVNMVKLKETLPSSRTMGNLNTFVLNSGSCEQVEALTRKLIEKDVDVISPACGLSMSTPIANIQAMTREARRY
jgi:[methyl-Co(III) methanol-specific corrinoid protein]:coenzyme M methyltransferase